MPEIFIGRQAELTSLSNMLEQKASSLCIVRGRRRIGKSRLIREFGKNHTYYEFSGLLPDENTTAQSQRDEFMRQFAEQTHLPQMSSHDWGNIFHLLGEQVKTGLVIVLFDEISWMGSLDPNFVGKLKIAWDLYFKKNPELILILCGSVSSWIEKNILANSGFLGRPTMKLTLEELPLPSCNYFWQEHSASVSNYDKLKMLSVTGGVPRYLELINPKRSADENIQELCFKKDGILVTEFKYIFSDIFGKRNNVYEKIVERLALGSCNQQEIASYLNREQSGIISEFLEDLISAGFVNRDYTWHLQSGKISKLSNFRLKDNYLRFYLKYIHPNLANIEKGNMDNTVISSFPGWDSIMALQFENLVINNSRYIKNHLKLRPESIIFDNPYFQRKTNRDPGCQIDYLIQTRFSTVYVFEIKFSRQKITGEIVDEMKNKIKNLKLPKHISYRPVLIHVNGVQDSVIESQFFTDTIDFGEFLTG